MYSVSAPGRSRLLSIRTGWWSSFVFTNWSHCLETSRHVVVLIASGNPVNTLDVDICNSRWCQTLYLAIEFGDAAFIHSFIQLIMQCLRCPKRTWEVGLQIHIAFIVTVRNPRSLQDTLKRVRELNSSYARTAATWQLCLAAHKSWTCSTTFSKASRALADVKIVLIARRQSKALKSDTTPRTELFTITMNITTTPIASLISGHRYCISTLYFIIIIIK